jgi:hypothetical protein
MQLKTLSRRLARLALWLACAAVLGLYIDPIHVQAQQATGQPQSTQAGRPIPGAGQKLAALQLATLIDDEIQLRLKQHGLTVSPLADDGEFLRRLYLDLVGVVPTAEETAEFLDDKNPSKRREVIDRLLADPRFGQFHAESLTRLLLPREPGRRLNPVPFIDWLAGQLNENVPLDLIAHTILTATGNQAKKPAVLYYSANFTSDRATDNVTRMFLGVQLQCAQCHNHPFTAWKKQEFWAMAQFFSKTRLTGNVGRQSINEVKPTLKKGTPPDPSQNVPAKFLGGSEVKLDEDQPYRPVLAKWITSPTNPYFARAMVNRFWYQLFGRGLVNPVDDMHDNNPPSHPELLSALAEQFRANDHDLRYLLTAICNSAAYQRTSRPTGNNAADKTLYSHRLVRVLTAEQLYESLVSIVGQEMKSRDGKTVLKGKKGPPTGMGSREVIISTFRVNEGYDPLDYQYGIPQLLRLMNTSATTATRTAVDGAIKTARNEPARIVEQLFLVAVSRRPSAEESSRMRTFLAAAKNQNTAYNDILWALLNSSEFVLNH